MYKSTLAEAIIDGETLTDVNALATQKIVDNPDTRLYLETLNRLWNKLTLRTNSDMAA